MPSGAKKRKAAKKKKQQKEAQRLQNNNDDNHNPLGNDDPRNLDERESEDGTSSSASHDHEKDQNSFAESNEESANEIIGNAEYAKNVGLDNECTIKIERDLKPEGNMEITDSSFENDESSGSNSSSDDEIKKRSEEEEANDSASHEGITFNGMDEFANSLTEKAKKITGSALLSDATINGTPETVPVSDSIKPAGSTIDELVHINGILDENEEKPSPKLDDENTSIGLGVLDCNLEKKDGKTSALLDPVAESNGGHKLAEESKILGSFEKTPLVGPAHPVVRRTSWLSCCGLLDFMTGTSL